MPFENRSKAGRLLAAHLEQYAGRADSTVLTLPGNSVLVAADTAEALHLPLDLVLVRKLTLPGEQALMLGAVATGGVQLLKNELLRALGIANDVIHMVAAAEQRQLERQERYYRGLRPPQEIAGRTALLIDDGLTDSTLLQVVIDALRRRQAADVILAMPVAPREVVEELGCVADDVVCPTQVTDRRALDAVYAPAPPLSEETLRDLLRRAVRESRTARHVS